MGARLSVLLVLLVCSAASGLLPVGRTAHGDEQSAALAVVDGEPITEADVAKALGAPLARLEQQLYRMKRQKLDALIEERLLAREAVRRGMSVEALLAAEVADKAEVGDDEALAYVEANEARFRGDDRVAHVERARARLRRERERALRAALLERLRSRANVTVALAPPPPYRVELAGTAVDPARVRGPAGAPVTIVEFSDFQCPACRRLQPTLEAVRARFGDAVRIVHHDFPLDDAHPQARRAAEAARCAGDQGRFWDFHDLLYRNQADLSVEALKRLAGEGGLDVQRFEACLTEGVHAEAVKEDQKIGEAVGVKMTPTLFVNGRPFSGAQPLGVLLGVIEEELAVAERTPRLSER